MVLEKLGESLKNTIQKVAKSLFIDEKLINELIKDIQRALLQADVNVNLVFQLSKEIKERALKEETKLPKKEHLIKIIYEELVKFLGEHSHELNITKKPSYVMLVGLFGSGKTTTAGKIAKYYKKRGNKIALLGLDTYRPAAMDQLAQVAQKVDVPFFISKTEKSPLKIYSQFKDQLSKFDIVLADTAGRDALSKDLIEELNRLNKEVAPEERLLVISADIGQAAQKQAEAFHDACSITGIIITKLDGTAKGGGALTASAITKAPVKFIGIGEKVDDFETFDPKRFVSRMLGMGDIETLLEKAKEAISEEDAKDLSKKLLKGEFSLVDLYQQMEAMKKMGPISKLMEMVPGFGQIKMPKEMLQVQEGKLEKWKFIMDSCTKQELEDPETISGTRIDRIAKGSGVSSGEVRELLKHYKQSKKLMKMLKGGDMKSMEKMMSKFKGKIPGM